jgi:hypothetical protein
MAEPKTAKGREGQGTAGDRGIVSQQARDLFEGVVQELRKAVPPAVAGESPRLFFPGGINLIEVYVEIAGAKVSLRIAGDKAEPSTASAIPEAFPGMAGLEAEAVPFESVAAEAADVLHLGQKVPNRPEIATVGAPTTIVRRDTPEFKKFVRNENPDIVFKDEEGTGADHMMTKKLSDRLDALAALVKREWSGVKLRVTEAWDENLEHATRSVHYEGRAADLTTSPLDSGKLGRLGRLAVEAGFEWVFFENKFHVHVSTSK